MEDDYIPDPEEFLDPASFAKRVKAIKIKKDQGNQLHKEDVFLARYL